MPRACSASAVTSASAAWSTTRTIGWPMARQSAAITCSISNGLGSTVKTPSWIASSISVSTAYAVIKITGICGHTRRICRKRSTPFIPGIRTSVSRRSKRCSRTSSRARAPSDAATTSKPSNSRLATSVKRSERSSSTMSTRMGVLGSPSGGSRRYLDDETRAHPGLAFDANAAFVRFHSSRNDRQSEPRPFRFGGEEWLEDLGNDVFRNTDTVVGYHDVPRLTVPSVGANDDFAITIGRYGFEAVLEKVQYDLLEVILVDAGDRQVLGHRIDDARLRLGKNSHRFVDERPERARLQGGRALAGEVQQVGDDFHATADFAFDHSEKLSDTRIFGMGAGIGARKPLGDEGVRVANGRERIA